MTFVKTQLRRTRLVYQSIVLQTTTPALNFTLQSTQQCTQSLLFILNIFVADILPLLLKSWIVREQVVVYRNMVSETYSFVPCVVELCDANVKADAKAKGGSKHGASENTCKMLRSDK